MGKGNQNTDTLKTAKKNKRKASKKAKAPACTVPDQTPEMESVVVEDPKDLNSKNDNANVVDPTDPNPNVDQTNVDVDDDQNDKEKDKTDLHYYMQIKKLSNQFLKK